ncbi:hypothetical protein [Streptomyces sp. NPDC018833]|uniref:hypothetical protein n=1 Tax=Streptomyces sp. NPDC018833 TaxID=3365053 RepID=UPI0037AA7E0D
MTTISPTTVATDDQAWSPVKDLLVEDGVFVCQDGSEHSLDDWEDHVLNSCAWAPVSPDDLSLELSDADLDKLQDSWSAN